MLATARDRDTARSQGLAPDNLLSVLCTLLVDVADACEYAIRDAIRIARKPRQERPE